jgi:hypothetical protein
MSQPVLTAQEMIAWNEKTSNGWRQFLAFHPELLSLPCDIAGVKTVLNFSSTLLPSSFASPSDLRMSLSRTTPMFPLIPLSRSTPLTCKPSRSSSSFWPQTSTGTHRSNSTPVPWARPAPHARPSSSMRFCTVFATTRSLPPLRANSESSLTCPWTTS